MGDTLGFQIRHCGRASREIHSDFNPPLRTSEQGSPFVNGDAVYSARAIVNYSEPIINQRSNEQSNETNDVNNNSEITVNVYPNPAENYINVELKGTSVEFCKFVIRNIFGTSLIEKQIMSDGSTITIDISQLKNGLYIYEVLNAMKVKIITARLVINK